jgi:hypothetical protein
LNGKLFWNQVWKTKNFKPNVKLAVEPDVKLRIEPHAKLRIKPRKRTLKDSREKAIENKRRERWKYLCPVRLSEERDIEPVETTKEVS